MAQAGPVKLGSGLRNLAQRMEENGWEIVMNPADKYRVSPGIEYRVRLRGFQSQGRSPLAQGQTHSEAEARATSHLLGEQDHMAIINLRVEVLAYSLAWAPNPTQALAEQQ